MRISNLTGEPHYALHLCLLPEDEPALAGQRVTEAIEVFREKNGPFDPVHIVILAGVDGKHLGLVEVQSR